MQAREIPTAHEGGRLDGLPFAVYPCLSGCSLAWPGQPHVCFAPALVATGAFSCAAHRMRCDTPSTSDGGGLAMDRSKTLIVVDDNEIAREGVGTVLCREGYTVGLIATGREALHYLRSCQRPDLILLDMFMPGLDGWAFLKEIQADPSFARI